jgi:hypothetical protein
MADGQDPLSPWGGPERSWCVHVHKPQTRSRFTGSLLAKLVRQHSHFPDGQTRHKGPKLRKNRDRKGGANIKSHVLCTCCLISVVLSL